MNNNVIEDVIKRTFAGTISFPEVISLLSEEGFVSYHVDYLRGENRYYHANDETISKRPDHKFPKGAKEFSPEKLQAIIRKTQAGSAKYPEFLEESAAAGCVYYIVFMTGKKVIYFGRDGSQHVEHFPGGK